MRRVAAGAVVTLVAIAGCAPEPRAVEWRFRFAREDLAARARSVEASITRGGCTIEGDTLFRTTFDARAPASMRPPELAPGTYGVRGRARDPSCRWFASGCLAVDLPSGASAPVVVILDPLLPEIDACGGGPCHEGACEAGDAGAADAAPDAPAPDAPPVDAPPGPIVPDDPGPADVRLDVDTTRDRRPISPYVYGVNEPDWARHGRRFTLGRESYSRVSTYNWENNASNGSAYFSWQNDGYYGGGETPGAAIWNRIDRAGGLGAAFVVPIPLLGHVAADKDGPVDVTSSSFLVTRFRVSEPRKPAPFAYPPDLDDAVVYQDELASWLETSFPGAHDDVAADRFVYELDAQPDNWHDAYPAIHPSRASYAEIRDRVVAQAQALHDVAPAARVLAPSVSGWGGLRNMNGAPDASAGEFFAWFLAAIRDAGGGTRLVDAFSLVWETEARSSTDIRVNGSSTAPEVVAARVQAPRSLWDPTFVESSWITAGSGEPIRLLPRLRETIEEVWPETGIAMVMWWFGGHDHPSGAVAAADVLGIYGREGVAYAAIRHPTTPAITFPYAAFLAYRDYDGAGGRFGDLSVPATTTAIEQIAVHASVDSTGGGRVVVVVINRATVARDAGLAVAHHALLRRAERYEIAGDLATIRALGELALPRRNALVVSVPPLSVTTLVLTP